MTKTELFTQSSPWFILLCLVIGGLYAFLLYTKKPVWSKQINIGLALLRGFIVSFICFLLLAPVIRQIQNEIEKPILLVAFDNSESIQEIHTKGFLDSLIKNFQNRTKDLGKEFEVRYTSLSHKDIKRLDSLKFNNPVTNLSTLLSDIQSDYDNLNLASVVLVSDGIFNQGISPNYLTYNFPISAVALGDTIPKKDINLRNVLYNKVAYRGNKFPIVVEYQAEGFNTETATISIKQNGKTIGSQEVKLDRTNNIKQTTFYVSSEKPGMQHFEILLLPLPGEFTQKNNKAHAYIDVIDNKEKILLIAATPHPDIKAIRTALETKENYDFQLYIPGIDVVPKEPKYDLIIFHQIPDMGNMHAQLLNDLGGRSKNHLYVLGNQSNVNQFNVLTTSVDISVRGNQKDEVFPSLNPLFRRFTLEETYKEVIEKLPPVVVPFADYQLPPHYDVILFQRVGTLTTNKPLVAVGNENERKTGVIIGNGIWEWRIQEFVQTNKTEVFDGLITKMVQYLSSREDKRKFRVYPVSNEVFETEPVVFETEVYNNIYEKIYGQKIDLQITGETGKKLSYSYTNTQNNSRYEVGGLNPGMYTYKATTQLDNKVETSSGEFIVKELEIEAINTTANHSVLKELARQSGGAFFYPAQLNNLQRFLLENKAIGKIHTYEENRELIHLKWLFFLILFLACGEWALRKYFGAY